MEGSLAEKVNENLLRLSLVHHSATPLASVFSSSQRDHRGSKPCGLWVSVEGEQSWREWCEAENFGIGQYEYDILMAPNATILWLASAADIMAFSDRYGSRQYTSSDAIDYIDWDKIAQRYQGIIIAPYQWSCRLDDRAFWYYGWDCASGCIWDATAIADLRARAEKGE